MGFERGQAEGLHLAGHEHQVGEGRRSCTLSCLPRNECGPARRGGQRGARRRSVGAVADEHEAGGHGAGDTGKDFDDVGDALDRAEVGEMDEEFFFVPTLGAGTCGHALDGRPRGAPVLCAPV